MRDAFSAAATTMPALAFYQFDGPQALTVIERPVPEVRPEQVLVKVAYSTINPSDLMMISGQQAAMMHDLVPPYVAGMEFSGHILALGSEIASARPDLAIGAPVMGVINPRLRQGGAHQGVIAVSPDQIVPLAKDDQLIAAAAVPMNGLTALLALEQIGLHVGQHVLVTGGSGILGAMVIALAKAGGAIVYAGGQDPDHAQLKRLGVDYILPRQEGLVQAALALRPSGLDALIDCALIGNDISAALAPGAVAVSVRKSHPITDPRLRADYVAVVGGMMRNDLLQRLAALFHQGALAPRLASAPPFGLNVARIAFDHAIAQPKAGRFILRLADI